MITLFFVAAVISADPAAHPLVKDCTGIDWVLPFNEAHEAAGKQKRVLLIKPVAFGTSPDGGW